MVEAAAYLKIIIGIKAIAALPEASTVIRGELLEVISSTNYSAYTTRPTNRYEQRTVKLDSPLGLEDMGHSDHSTQFSDSGDSRAHAAQNVTRRQYENTWGGNPELPVASETSVAAAQRAVSELFPELTSGDDNAYTSHSGEADYSLYSRGGGAHYYQPSSPYQRRSNDPNYYHGGPSSYDSGSSHGGSAASNYAAHDQRPRRDYPSTLSPHPQSPLQTTHLNNTAYYNHSAVNYDSEFDDSEDDSEDEDDENDNECARSAIIIRETGSPAGYYPGSSASPSVVSVDTPGPGTPLTTKYSSPEILTASNVDSVPKRQRQGVARTSKKLAQSATSSGPKRVRKAAPATAVAMAASAITHENYDDNDAQLVYYRQMGVSYKTIKAKLGLDEAESTLRGRYRTLTKPKNERLRKPVWSDEDIILLLESVEPDLPHIKWKQVSDNIVMRGGSYKFGSSTCKKKYLELVAENRAIPLCEAAGASKRRKHRGVGPPSARKKA
ncbi:hypothetical protein EDC01DRAFT_780894 [Geopyxis carbonaria]|nr:hypothetical protein EDC01DRAFT_780894 [Geopyxis carbonaria]